MRRRREKKTKPHHVRTMKSLMLNYIYICSEHSRSIVVAFMTINVQEPFLCAPECSCVTPYVPLLTSYNTLHTSRTASTILGRNSWTFSPSVILELITWHVHSKISCCLCLQERVICLFQTTINWRFQ